MSKNNLKEELKKRGLSYLSFYKMTGIPPCSISQIANGKLEPFPGWKRRICIALDVRSEELFPEDQEV